MFRNWPFHTISTMSILVHTIITYLYYCIASNLSFCSFLPTDYSQHSWEGSLKINQIMLFLCQKPSNGFPSYSKSEGFYNDLEGPIWSVFLFITFLTSSPTIPSLIQFMPCYLLNTLDKFPPELGDFFFFFLEYSPTAQTYKGLFSYLFQFNFIILFQICSDWQLFWQPYLTL